MNHPPLAKKCFFLQVLIIFCSIALTCFAADTAASQERRSLTYCTDQLPTYLDPLRANSAALRTVIRPLFDRLVDTDPHTGKIGAALATEWAFASDGLTASFKLRPNVRFQSTQYFQPSKFLSAEDVVDSLQRAVRLGKLTASKSNSWIISVHDDGPSTNIKAFSSAVKDISDDGPDRVVITFNYPMTLDLLPILASPEFSIVSGEFVSKATNGVYRFPDFAIGTGPLKAISHDTMRVEFLPNENYWNPTVTPDPIAAIQLSNTPEIAAIQVSDLCDAVAYMPSTAVNTLVSSTQFDKFAFGTDRLKFLAFSHASTPRRTDNSFNTAVLSAIDRVKLVQSIAPGAKVDSGFGSLTTSSHLIPSSQFNPKQADEQLKRLRDPLSSQLSLYYDPTNIERKFVDAVGSNLGAFGISAKAKEADKGLFVINDGEDRSAWVFSSRAGPNLHSTMLETGLCQWACSKSSLDKLQQVRDTQDPILRNVYEQEALKSIESDGYVVPLIRDPEILAIRKLANSKRSGAVVRVDSAGVIDLVPTSRGYVPYGPDGGEWLTDEKRSAEIAKPNITEWTKALGPSAYWGEDKIWADSTSKSASTAQPSESSASMSYRAVFSPQKNSSPLTLFDGRTTTVEFSIAPGSAPNDLPKDQRLVPHLPSGTGGAMKLTINLSCSFCDHDRLQRQDITFLPDEQKSTPAIFKIVPLASATGADGRGQLIFTISARGVNYDQVSLLAFVAKDLAAIRPSPDGSINMSGKKMVSATAETVDVILALTQNNSESGLGIDLEIYDPELVQLIRNDPELVQLVSYDADEAKLLGRFRTRNSSLDEIRRRMYEGSVAMRRFTNPQEWEKLRKAGEVANEEAIKSRDGFISEKTRDEVLQVLVDVGAAVYRDLFFDSEPPIDKLLAIIETYGGKQAKTERPLRLQFQSFKFFLPWQLLNNHGRKPGIRDFWGFMFQMAIRPMDVRTSFSRNISTTGVVFGHYDDVKADKEVSDLGKEQATKLVQLVSGADVIPADGRLFLRKVAEKRKSVGLVATFTHARLLPSEMLRMDFSSNSYIFPEDLDRLISNEIGIRESFFSAAPVVLLNACETAATAPHDEYGNTFVGRLFKMGASGVIATQGEIPEYFGRQFGGHLMEAILQGREVSRALWEQRLLFLKERNNPFGLLYTFYGDDLPANLRDASRSIPQVPVNFSREPR